MLARLKSQGLMSGGAAGSGSPVVPATAGGDGGVRRPTRESGESVGSAGSGRPSGEEGGGPRRLSGWGKVRATQQAASMTNAWKTRLDTWGGALEALKEHRLLVAVQRLLAQVKTKVFGDNPTMSMQALKAAMSGGPVGAVGQYGGTRSRVVTASLNPVWNTYMEVRLEGGVLDTETGEYDNDSAPYTSLRLEIWDRDRLSRDDFIGEVTVRLCPLMDARTHAYEMELTDPEGKTGAEDGLKGSIKFELKYES